MILIALILANPLPLATDLQRDALLNESDRWFHWLIAFTGILALGCLLEVGESIIEGLEWNWHRTGKPFQEQIARWTVPTSIIGVFLVIIGVAGEGYAEARQAIAETKIRQYDETSLRDALRRVADTEAELLREKTDRFLSDKGSLVASLRKNSGTSYSLYTAEDQESFNLVRQIDNALQEAGWHRKQPPLGFAEPAIAIFSSTHDPVPLCFVSGISVHFREVKPPSFYEKMPNDQYPPGLKAASDLRIALAKYIMPEDVRNVASSVYLDKHPGKEIPLRICVGKKP